MISAGTLLWALVVWAIVFPLIYGQLLSRAFGLKKPIDHWIVFCLHISAGVLVYVICFIAYFFIQHIVWVLIIFYLLIFGIEGIIWQVFLRDRKMNGFLVSLICNAVFVIPVAVMFALYGISEFNR